jgi:hypothetical protein
MPRSWRIIHLCLPLHVEIRPDLSRSWRQFDDCVIMTTLLTRFERPATESSPIVGGRPLTASNYCRKVFGVVIGGSEMERIVRHFTACTTWRVAYIFSLVGSLLDKLGFSAGIYLRSNYRTLMPIYHIRARRKRVWHSWCFQYYPERTHILHIVQY